MPITVASVEPNDGPPNANPTGLGANGAVVIDGTIEQADFDFYSIVAEANQKLTIDIDAEILGSALDSAVAILNSSGQIVAFNLDANGSRDSFVEFVIPESGVYFVLVTTLENFIGAPSSTGTYTATITSVALGSGEIEQAAVFVQQGETLLVLVTGADDTSSGDFSLELSNFDQFATPDLETLRGSAVEISPLTAEPVGAYAVGLLGARRLARGEGGPAAELVPHYLLRTEAEQQRLASLGDD